MSQEFESIEIERDGPVALLRMNRPERLNALNATLRSEVQSALNQFADDPAVRVVILSGSGRAFCSGYDISGDGVDRSSWGVAEWQRYYAGEGSQFPKAIWRFPKPLIAAVHGYALGGGCELAMLCDMTIAAESTKFGEPEIRFASGSTLIMPWVVPIKIAKQLLLTGELIDAHRAAQVGMVNEVVEDGSHEQRAMYYAQMLSKVAALGTQLTKEGLNRTYELRGLEQALAYHDNLVAIMHGTETDEGRAFREVREREGLKAAFKWRDAQFAEVEEKYG